MGKNVEGDSLYGIRHSFPRITANLRLLQDYLGLYRKLLCLNLQLQTEFRKDKLRNKESFLLSINLLAC